MDPAPDQASDFDAAIAAAQSRCAKDGVLASTFYGRPELFLEPHGFHSPLGPATMLRRPPVYAQRPETINAVVKKDEKKEQAPAPGSEGIKIVDDPFRPYDPVQTVAEVPGSHLVVLLNRFSVEPLALLAITEEFKSNFAPPSQEDFAELVTFVSKGWFRKHRSLVLKNCGSGGSQVHFHINVFPTIGPNAVPLPLLPNVEALIAERVDDSGCLNPLSEVCGAPHFVAKFSKGVDVKQLQSAYTSACETLHLHRGDSVGSEPLRMRVRCRLSTQDAGQSDEFHDVSFEEQLLPHKLYLTNDWMIVIGPMHDIKKFGQPFSLPVNTTFALFGLCSYTTPPPSLDDSEATQAERVDALKNLSMCKASLAQLMQEAYEPGSVSL